MASVSMADSYLWVTGTGPSVPKDGDVRRKIRRQAMRKVAAERRSRGNYGKTNVGQLPLECCKPQSSETKATIRNPRAVVRTTLHRRGLEEIPRSLPATGFERLKIDYGVDLLDFSALISFHVGQAAIKELHSKPDQLLDILRCRQWSYFTYLPQHYGHAPYLDDALNCVAGRVRQYLLGIKGRPQKSVARSYMRALRSLQNALADPLRRSEPEVLCACAVLAIYELLEWPWSQTWTRHVVGAAALIKFRGPGAYKTEFEKALLLALAGPIYTDAMLKVEPCYLDEPEWRSALASCVLECSTFTDCSSLVIELWTKIVRMPRLLRDVEDVVMAGMSDTLAMEHVDYLREQADSLHLELLAWRAAFDAVTDVLGLDPAENHPLGMNERPWETLGIYLANLIMLDRAIAALDVSRGSETAQEITGSIDETLTLRENLRLINPRAHIFLNFKVAVTDAALQTQGDWAKACEGVERQATGRPKLISWPMYKRWVELKGRKADRCLK